MKEAFSYLFILTFHCLDMIFYKFPFSPFFRPMTQIRTWPARSYRLRPRKEWDFKIRIRKTKKLATPPPDNFDNANPHDSTSCPPEQQQHQLQQCQHRYIVWTKLEKEGPADIRTDGLKAPHNLPYVMITYFYNKNLVWNFSFYIKGRLYMM